MIKRKLQLIRRKFKDSVYDDSALHEIFQLEKEYLEQYGHYKYIMQKYSEIINNESYKRKDFSLRISQMQEQVQHLKEKQTKILEPVSFKSQEDLFQDNLAVLNQIVLSYESKNYDKMYQRFKVRQISILSSKRKRHAWGFRLEKIRRYRLSHFNRVVLKHSKEFDYSQDSIHPQKQVQIVPNLAADGRKSLMTMS